LAGKATVNLKESTNKKPGIGNTNSSSIPTKKPSNSSIRSAGQENQKA